jgi:hypothetical protein
VYCYYLNFQGDTHNEEDVTANLTSLLNHKFQLRNNAAESKILGCCSSGCKEKYTHFDIRQFIPLKTNELYGVISKMIVLC